MSSKYYRKLSKDVYQCLVCDRPYSGPMGRHAATKCCDAKKPVIEIALSEADEVVNAYLDKTRLSPELTADMMWADIELGALVLPAKPAKKPRRTPAQVVAQGGKSDSKKADIILGQAMAKADRAAFNANLDNILSTCGQADGHECSALQKLAYAFHLHSWTAVKGAAYDLALEIAERTIARGPNWTLAARCEEVLAELDNLAGDLGIDPAADPYDIDGPCFDEKLFNEAGE
ncbi:hypothetical protein Dform_00860 [Dehalogenimonas formicexedens]|uniref:Uncharacterized protein n=1 Tax=Dehalogenimonas formicexedens TaxID=1839801 RepID=A0A1P8F707_9CHLR|nr:hypothetical protein [Dehalogenimonas formicexedens]APV44205.1 hypothetical protein Dform_00860 [Dehalogenimonas formicexedens]